VIGDRDYSWMDHPTISAPLPYSVQVRRRRVGIVLSALSLLSIIGGALFAFNH